MKFNRRLFGGYNVKQVNQFFQQIEQSYQNNLRAHDEKRREDEDKIARMDQELEKFRQQDVKLVEAVRRMDRKPGHERVIKLLNARVKQLEDECEKVKADNQRLFRLAQSLKGTGTPVEPPKAADQPAAQIAKPGPGIKNQAGAATPISDVPEPYPNEPPPEDGLRENEDPDWVELLRGVRLTRRPPDQRQLDELEKVNRELGLI